VARELSVVIACGGTGGHLFPGIAVAEELDRRGHRPLLLISRKRVDAEASAKYEGLDFEEVPAIAKPAAFSPRMVSFLWRLWRTAGQAKRFLKERGADAVIGMGGFTSLPPVYAGHRLNLAAFVHESNALPGKANRLTSRWCRKVFVGFEAARGYFPGCEVVLTGTPVRKEMRDLPSRAEAMERLGLETGKPTVLVFGGSQGARRLNSLVVEASAELGDNVQWVHLAGQLDHERVRAAVAGRSCHVVFEFCHDMPSAYVASDLAVCRAGASSLTELAFVGLPAILVPYPYAADDHQTRNAEACDRAGAALLAQERDLDAKRLALIVHELLNQPEKLKAMGDGMRSLAVDDSAGRICDHIEAS